MRPPAPNQAIVCRRRLWMEYTHTIDGQGETSDAHFDVINPADGKPFAQCPDATKAQLDRTVVAARRAFESWRTLSFEERRDYLNHFGQAFKERTEDLIPLLIREQGKPLAAAR